MPDFEILESKYLEAEQSAPIDEGPAPGWRQQEVIAEKLLKFYPNIPLWKDAPGHRLWVNWKKVRVVKD